jgi:hypothetical protein
MDYILSCSVNYSQEYRTFFHLFSLGMAELTSTKIEKSTHKMLCRKTTELLAMHDAMFPPSESNFCFHQLQDNVNKIYDLSTSRSSCALHVERALSVIKLFVTKGGPGSELTAFKRYIGRESQFTNDHYDFNVEELHEHGSSGKSKLIKPSNFSVVLDGFGNKWLSYTDEPFSLFQPTLFNFNPPTSLYKSYEYKLTIDESRELFETIVEDIHHRAGSTKKALQISPFYRIIKGYEHRARRDLVTHTKSLTQKNNQLKRLTLNAWANEIINEQESYFQVYTYTESDPIVMEGIEEIINDGIIFKRDIAVMAELLQNQCWSYTMYDKALILGSNFMSRGFDKRETVATKTPIAYGSDIMGLEGKNEYNVLKNNWTHKDHISTWCKFEDKYAQVNAFLQIHFPQDKFVDGVCIASVTTRKCITHDYVDYILSNNIDSLETQLFIPALRIIPTPILHTGAVHFPPPQTGASSSSAIISTFSSSTTNPETKLRSMLPHAKPIYVGEFIMRDCTPDAKQEKFVANCDGSYQRNTLSFLKMVEMQRTRSKIKPKKDRETQYRSKQVFSQRYEHNLYFDTHYTN